MNINILQFDSLVSTNETAIEHARRGAAEGLCVTAREQTSGRGRLGRSWQSGKDAGLYFSILLRPKIEIRLYPLITLMTAIAVFDVLEDLYGLKPDIKWPNDILIKGRKISGILAESVESPGKSAVVVGIGINLDSRHFTSVLETAATSIEEETGKRAVREELTGTLTRFLDYYYQILGEEDGAAIICSEWETRSSFARGKTIRAISGEEMITGKTCGLEKDGALRIQTENGDYQYLRAGDIESLRENNDNLC